MSSNQYASYVSPKLGISIGTFASIIRGNKALFTRLFTDLQSGNTADIAALETMVANSQPLSTIVKSLADTPNSMAAPLALTYNGAVALGLLPPAIAQALTNLGANLNNVVIDFGYNAHI